MEGSKGWSHEMRKVMLGDDHLTRYIRTKYPNLNSTTTVAVAIVYIGVPYFDRPQGLVASRRRSWCSGSPAERKLGIPTATSDQSNALGPDCSAFYFIEPEPMRSGLCVPEARRSSIWSSSPNRPRIQHLPSSHLHNHCTFNAAPPFHVLTILCSQSV